VGADGRELFLRLMAWSCATHSLAAGSSVLEMVKAFENASGKKVEYKVRPRNWQTPR
jgi:UDP-glucose 4-epimerase